MRSRRSAFSLVLVIIVVAGAFYYFYSYRNRSVAADMNSIDEYAGDASTTTAVKTALALNKQVSSMDVHVDTTGDSVTLTGQVPSEAEKSAVEKIVRGTKGVAQVVNNLQVDPTVKAAGAQSEHVTSVEIKAAVLQSILNNPDLKAQQIKVDVAGGVVTLSGSVQTPGQKAAAEAVARKTPNVQRVDSNTLSVAGAPPESRTPGTN